jgi:hypothetical protein
MLTLTGTHGTPVTNVAFIQKQGFKSCPGRKGSGAYFWAYRSDVERAKQLGFDWCLRSGSKDCAVLVCSFACDESVYLDFESLEHKEGFRAISDAMISRMPTLEAKRSMFISNLYDYYVRKLEKELSISYAVFHAEVAPPKNNVQIYDVSVFGGLNCYIVKHASLIKINEVLNKNGDRLWPT